MSHPPPPYPAANDEAGSRRDLRHLAPPPVVLAPGISIDNRQPVASYLGMGRGGQLAPRGDATPRAPFLA
jgi:hypothetical protein